MGEYDSARLFAVASRNGGIVSAADCRSAGLRYTDIAARCRSGEWSRLARGAYLLNADLRDGPTRAEMIRAAVASFGPDAVVGLQTAVLWPAATRSPKPMRGPSRRWRPGFGYALLTTRSHQINFNMWYAVPADPSLRAAISRGLATT